MKGSMTTEKRKRAGDGRASASPAKVKRSRRRARARRARLIRNVVAASLVVATVLGIAGVAVWLALDRHPEATMRRYPMEYVELIRENAAANGLDPAYPAAVIMAESDYQPDAVSEANAQGLMQLLPDTAQWIAGKFDEAYVEGCLFAPEINIKYGCWYLGWLLRRFDGDMTCATAAYHAGQGRVDEWLADPALSPDGATLETIPSGATATYVGRVLSFYETYRTLYADAERAA